MLDLAELAEADDDPAATACRWFRLARDFDRQVPRLRSRADAREATEAAERCRQVARAAWAAAVRRAAAPPPPPPAPRHRMPIGRAELLRTGR